MNDDEIIQAKLKWLDDNYTAINMMVRAYETLCKTSKVDMNTVIGWVADSNRKMKELKDDAAKLEVECLATIPIRRP